jgi:hypothetical protein
VAAAPMWPSRPAPSSRPKPKKSLVEIDAEIARVT